jgi:predicted NBD/HSP70 family sugar kinase
MIFLLKPIIIVAHSFATRYNIYMHAILAIDIGGTKIAFGAINEASNEFIFTDQTPTPKGKEALGKTISEIIAKSSTLLTQKGFSLNSSIGIGSPGRFVGPNNDTLAPLSARNLEATPGEFDGLNLQSFLSDSVGKPYTLIVRNDAIAQMAGAMQVLLNGPNADLILDNKVAYLGPGTGLGGGVAEVSPEGKFTFHTDGHLSNIEINDEVIGLTRVEDVCCGPAFKEWTGVTTKEVNHNEELLQHYKNDIKRIGRNLAKAMINVNTGNIHMIVPDQGWSNEDIEFAKDTELFLIGGSLGTKGKLSEIIRSEARVYLDKEGFDKTAMVKIPEVENAALLGAASFL